MKREQKNAGMVKYFWLAALLCMGLAVLPGCSAPEQEDGTAVIYQKVEEPPEEEISKEKLAPERSPQEEYSKEDNE